MTTTQFPVETVEKLQDEISTTHSLLTEVHKDDPEFTLPDPYPQTLREALKRLLAMRENLAWTSYVLGERLDPGVTVELECATTVMLLIDQKYQSLSRSIEQIEEILR